MSRTARRSRPFWLRPKWVVGHVLVVALVVTFVSLGFWQLARLDDRKARNAEVLAQAQEPITPIEEVVAPGVQLGDVEDLRYRPVSLTGTYDPDSEVLVRPRSLDGASGWHVVTPLVIADGRAVLVTRGFAPFGTDLDVVRRAAAPPSGEVTVTGLVFPTQERDGIGPTDPETGTLEELARVDIARVQQQYEATLLPVYVQLETQEPPQTEGLPQLLPTPTTDEGPHLAYAGQWFLFAAVGLIGWPILLRRTAQDEHRGGGRDDGGNRGGSGGSGVRPPTSDHPRQPVDAGTR